MCDSASKALLCSFLLLVLVSCRQPEASHPQAVSSAEPEVSAAPPIYSVVERISTLEATDFYPCTDCHDGEEDPVPIIRELTNEHDDIKLNHGEQRFWCLTCHHIDDRDWLVDQAGHKISFNASNQLCAMCHFQQERDFTHGAHGKRLEFWQGERLLMPCTACHNPHDPEIKPRKPWQPPQTRKGLPAGRDPSREGSEHQGGVAW